MRFTKFGLMRWVPAGGGGGVRKLEQEQRQQQEQQKGTLALGATSSDEAHRSGPRKRQRSSPPAAGGSSGSADTSSASHDGAARNASASFSSYGAAEVDAYEDGVPLAAAGSGVQHLSRHGEPKYSPGDDPCGLGGMWLLVSCWRPTIT